MRKLLFIVFSVALLMQGCSQSDIFMDEQYVSEKEIVREDIEFPKHIEAFGKGVAKEIEVTVGNLNDLNIDYSEIADSTNFREKFYKDWYNANPTVAKTRAAGTTYPLDMMSATEFMEKYNSLTNVQLEFIQKIIGQCKKSRSDQDLLYKLIDLNKEIHVQVPEIEQERLLNIIAVLYYGLQKVSYLEAQGLMLKTPYNSIKLSKVKTRSGNENIGSIVGYCRDLTGTIWAIALAEPSPYGEVGATAGTVLIWVGAAAAITYAVISCNEVEKNSNEEFCMEKYLKCTETKYGDAHTGGWGYTMCHRCYDYCIMQGVWSCPRPI